MTQPPHAAGPAKNRNLSSRAESAPGPRGSADCRARTTERTNVAATAAYSATGRYGTKRLTESRKDSTFHAGNRNASTIKVAAATARSGLNGGRVPRVRGSAGGAVSRRRRV